MTHSMRFVDTARYSSRTVLPKSTENAMASDTVYLTGGGGGERRREEGKEEGTNKRTNERPGERTGRAKERTNEQTHERANANARANERTRTDERANEGKGGGSRGTGRGGGAKKAKRNEEKPGGERQGMEVLSERERPDGLSHAGRFWRDIS